MKKLITLGALGALLFTTAIAGVRPQPALGATLCRGCGHSYRGGSRSHYGGSHYVRGHYSRGHYVRPHYARNPRRHVSYRPIRVRRRYSGCHGACYVVRPRPVVMPVASPTADVAVMPGVEGYLVPTAVPTVVQQ